MDILLLLTAFLVGAIVGALFLWARKARLDVQLNEAQQNLHRLETERDNLRQSLDEFQKQILALSQERAGLEAECSSLRGSLEDYKAKLEQKEQELRSLQQGHQKSLQELAGLQKQLESLQENLNWKNEHTQQLQAVLENMMQKVVKDSTDALQSQSQQSLDTLLKPFREQLERLFKDVEYHATQHQHSVSKLEGFIIRILEDSAKLSQQTENLTKALRGDIRVQGRWGEDRLKELLELAGFKEGEQYQRQVTLKGENGENLRPDIIFNLPDNRYIIVDAKVSITAYDKYCSEAEEGKRKLHLDALVDSFRKHIKELAKYQKVKVSHIGWTILFCPVEGALQTAFHADPTLLEEAQKARVILVGPLFLTGFIHLTGQLWQYEKRNRSIEKITELAKKLLDKLGRFGEEMKKLEESLDKANKSYKSAYDYLVSGKENVIITAKRIEECGITPTKSLPNTWVEDAIASEEREKILSFPENGESK
ncbi:MAG: DNA recombination protein RmuC [Bacteroidia bacterium]|nr:DNA recombination protein RmuC [Bacteroidia bacterium]MDW8235824.1 DNA recombination protein RmuC [Bacteroidia bacterium]